MKHFYDLKYNSLKLLLKSQLNLKTRLILYATISTTETVKYYLKNTWIDEISIPTVPGHAKVGVVFNRYD